MHTTTGVRTTSKESHAAPRPLRKLRRVGQNGGEPRACLKPVKKKETYEAIHPIELGHYQTPDQR